MFFVIVADVVEDGFKLVCMRAHYAVGGLLGASLRRAILQSTALPVARHAASVAAEAVRFGTVAVLGGFTSLGSSRSALVVSPSAVCVGPAGRAFL